MEALALAVVASIPNFAGFLMMALSNNRTISKLFAQLATMIKKTDADSGKEIIILKAKVALLEDLIGQLLTAFKTYPVPMGDVTKELSENLFAARPVDDETTIP